MAGRQMHREVFLAASGFGPWPCMFCGDPVHFMDVFIVHHKDENQSNNGEDNLGAVHWGCHSSHHHSGRKRPKGTGAKISAANKGRPKRGIAESNRRRRGESRRHRGRKHPDGCSCGFCTGAASRVSNTNRAYAAALAQARQERVESPRPRP